jgi:hypothetical protein
MVLSESLSRSPVPLGMTTETIKYCHGQSEVVMSLCSLRVYSHFYSVIGFRHVSFQPVKLVKVINFSFLGGGLRVRMENLQLHAR